MKAIIDNLREHFQDISDCFIVNKTQPGQQIGSQEQNSTDQSVKSWTNWLYNTPEPFNFLRIRLAAKKELSMKRLSQSHYLVVLNERENVTQLLNYMKAIISMDLDSGDTPNLPSPDDKEVEHVDDKILDALRIQKLIIPDKETISKNFRKFFIFHQQQDTVGGDFYWYQKTSNGVLLALIDCTGHSVEGAMTSMVCNSLLNQAFSRFDEEAPQNLIKDFYQQLIDYNEKAKSSIDYGIGAEVGLFYFTDSDHVIRFFSTGISAFIRKKEGIELLKARKVMDYNTVDKSISSFEINKSEVVELYSFTDGLTDQFDADDSKKLGYRGVKRMIEQEQKFDSTYYKNEIEKWKGINMQYDDITLMGLAI
ncbi:MAG: SpoIIE family protein phosphatase [Bacteroidota bacterium]